MLAILVYDPNQLLWKDVPAALLAWVRDAGGVAALALFIWTLAYVIRYLVERPAKTSEQWSFQNRLFVLALASMAVMYMLFFVFLFLEGTIPRQVKIEGKEVPVNELTPHELLFLTIGGACALLAVAVPFVASLSRLRYRRIWAIAKLSIKETIRHRILWVFTLLLLVVLFASWFIDSRKPEYQLRNYIWVVDYATAGLLLLAASLLAAFSIPADVKSQTIHTVVTKPVERFEIVLGRFLGYTLLFTAVLAVMTCLSLLYVFRSINPEARKESYKARVPIYGEVALKGTEGINPGKEYTHDRKYISGPSRSRSTSPHYAIWSFDHIPEQLGERKRGVLCEFTFDVYRTHKGEEGKGIFCNFKFVTANCPLNDRMEPENGEEIKKEVEKLGTEQKSSAEIGNIVAEKYGFFQVPSQEVTTFHTQSIRVPSGLFRNALHAEETGLFSSRDEEAPALRVIVNVTSQSKAQLVGVAKQDLYFLDKEKTFEQNYFKAALGLWYRLVLLIGIAVACSTYLSGIISWLCTMFLFGLGLFKDQIQQMVVNVSDGGGPIEAMIKLARHQPLAATLEETPTVRVGLGIDEAFRWMLGHILKLIPDVNRFDLSRYIGNGFDISWFDVLFVDNFLRLVGYVLPWIVLGYYLIKYREVANPT
jgi:hypothetical protein